jgi:hypothetical protein
MIGAENKMTGTGAPGTGTDNSDPWAAFNAELDAWLDAGLAARFWWRDDDATRPGPLLDRLLEIAGDSPVALAVIPARAGRELAERLTGHNTGGGNVMVLQHGYAHENHAPAGEKKAEFGDHRSLESMLEEVSRGRGRIEELFGPVFEPFLTPPWNRICDSVASRLPDAGLQGLSRFGARGPADGDRVVNTHIDIVDWRGNRGFVGEARAIQAAVRHLAARRRGLADMDEPTGLLTHHRDHDEGCWRFIGALRDAVTAHPAAEWVMP